ncbi:hypothetical protein Ae201684P_017508 [Aphanomyces euteiches]|uniref:Uncharacterized protein n=1 Tax=Aphanomyces euteiches TaxID=100861 RepID=A0A6G0XMD7_9STRA|nr:hypothetical protein Ae201684_003261 [Aphanomyces euteiches]KAH9098292.1 hypothetical protein Ae201684P_017508 [Aphanomyces euteiches]
MRLSAPLAVKRTEFSMTALESAGTAPFHSERTLSCRTVFAKQSNRPEKTSVHVKDRTNDTAGRFPQVQRHALRMPRREVECALTAPCTGIQPD